MRNVWKEPRELSPRPMTSSEFEGPHVRAYSWLDEPLVVLMRAQGQLLRSVPKPTCWFWEAVVSAEKFTENSSATPWLPVGAAVYAAARTYARLSVNLPVDGVVSEPVPSQTAASKLGPSGDGNSVAATLGLKDEVGEEVRKRALGLEFQVGAAEATAAAAHCCTIDVTPQGKLPEVATQDGHRNDRLGHRVGLRVGVSIDCQSGVVLRRAESRVQERVHKARVVKATSDIAVPVLVARQDDDHLVVVGEVPELGEGLDVKGQRTDDVGQCQGCGANRSSERLGLIMSRSWPAHAGLPCLVYTTEHAISNVNAATWPPATPTARKLTATSPELAVAVAERLATLWVAGEAAASTCHWSLVPWCHSSVDKEVAFGNGARDTGEPEEGGKERARPADNQSSATSHPANLIVCWLRLHYITSALVSFSQVATPCWHDSITDTLLVLACLCSGRGLYVSKNGHIGSHEVRAGHGRDVLDCEQVEALGTQDLAKVAAEFVGGPLTAGCPDNWYTTDMLAEASPVLRLSSVARAVRLRLREEVLLEIVKMYVQSGAGVPGCATISGDLDGANLGGARLRARIVRAPTNCNRGPLCHGGPRKRVRLNAGCWRQCVRRSGGRHQVALRRTQIKGVTVQLMVVVLVAEATAVFLHNRSRLALTGTCTTSMTVSKYHTNECAVAFVVQLCQIQTCKDDEDVIEHLRSEEVAIQRVGEDHNGKRKNNVTNNRTAHDGDEDEARMRDCGGLCNKPRAKREAVGGRGECVKVTNQRQHWLEFRGPVAAVLQARGGVESARQLRGGAGGCHRCRGHHTRAIAVVPTEPQHAERRKRLASGHLDLRKCHNAAGTAPTVVTISEHKQSRARMLLKCDDLRIRFANSVVNGKEAASGDTVSLPARSGANMDFVQKLEKGREGKGRTRQTEACMREGGTRGTLKLTALPGS
eukprot:SM000064S19727  [mRNA]  locus=s64:80125:90642:+ [translate_table: standard]